MKTPGRPRPRSGRKGAAARPPPREDATIEVAVTAIGARGDGIAEHAGERLYVPLTAAGDRVRVRLLERRGVGRAARVTEILAPGPGRAPPPCPHFGNCGGCALQHLADAVYADWKMARLTQALARAGFAAHDLAPLARTPPEGRRRALFAALRPDSAATAVVGFNVRQGHRIVDVSGCAVLDPRIVAVLPALRRLLATLLAPGQRTAVAVTLLEGGVDLVLVWPQSPGLAMREALAAFAAAADVARLSWRGATSATAEPIVQRHPLGARFGDVVVAVPPGGFVQASAAGEAALVAAVAAGVGGARGIADLFCGAGTFTFPLAAAGARVRAVDVDHGALAALAFAARGRRGIEVAERDLLRQPLSAAELDRCDAVVFDPPRAGARAQAEALAVSKVPVVAAVSCNPDTFARDARILADGGYRLERVTPVDQFLWSPHLELAAIFRR